MHRFLSSMLDTGERCMDGFLDLANKYTALGEHMARLGESTASFKRDLARVLPQIDHLELGYLNDQHESFISNVSNAQPFREFAVLIHNKERVPNEIEASFVNPDNAPEAEAPGDTDDFEQMFAQVSEPEDEGEQSSEHEEDMDQAVRSFIQCEEIHFRTITALRAQQLGVPIEPEPEPVADPDNVQHLRNHFGISEDVASDLHRCLSRMKSYFASTAHLDNLASLPPIDTEFAPVADPDNGQPRDSLVLPSEGQGDTESNTPDVPEEMVALSEALADDEHNKCEPEETVDTETAAQEETVNQQMAGSQVP